MPLLICSSLFCQSLKGIYRGYKQIIGLLASFSSITSKFFPWIIFWKGFYSQIEQTMHREKRTLWTMELFHFFWPWFNRHRTLFYNHICYSPIPFLTLNMASFTIESIACTIFYREALKLLEFDDQCESHIWLTPSFFYVVLMIHHIWYDG